LHSPSRLRVPVIFLVAALAPGLFAAAAAADLAAKLAATRSAEDRARDAGRKPAEVIAFLGIEEDDTVVDLIAAGGWYTEVLSLAVGPEGKVYAQNTAFALQIRDGANDAAMTARLADDRLANVERLDRELDALGLAPGSVDAALTALNFHDVHDGGSAEQTAALLATVYAFLKPGGMFGLIDHAGVAGADNAKLHRIEEKLVRDAALAAGFRVESSDLLRNPADDHTRGVFDPEIRGKTDRFLLKLTKPAPAP
jgi:predicted methyltransferase